MRPRTFTRLCIFHPAVCLMALSGAAFGTAPEPSASPAPLAPVPAVLAPVPVVLAPVPAVSASTGGTIGEVLPATPPSPEAVGESKLEVRSPQELILALSRAVKPDWAAMFRAPVPVSFKSRAQTALMTGSVLTDGFLAAQAEDPQQCRNVGKDLMGLAKSLGVQTELLDRSRSLSDCAQKRDWLFLRRELDAIQTDLAGVLRKHNDESLVLLVSLGAWMRGEEIVAAILSENYTEGTAGLLRQPALCRLLEQVANPSEEKLRSDSFLASIRDRLLAAARLVGGSAEATLSKEEVGSLAGALSSMLQDINSRQN